MDMALVNRALLNIGAEPLTLDDKEAQNEAWLTAKHFYLSSMLEALAQAEWTGAKRRRELAPVRMPYKANADFRYAYVLPVDCARPVELDGQEYFETEGLLLFTGASPARLLYVSNGKYFGGRSTELETVVLNGEPVRAVSGGSGKREPCAGYISGGDGKRDRRAEAGDGVLSGGNGKRNFAEEEPAEDFPDYRRLELEPGFYLYWEYLLSSKYALRLTDKPDLSVVYFNKAAAAGKAAETASVSRSAARIKAPPTWQEELGLY